jgi:hypothetical protein
LDISPAVKNGLEHMSMVWTGAGSYIDTEPPVKKISFATSAPTPWQPKIKYVAFYIRSKTSFPYTYSVRELSLVEGFDIIEEDVKTDMT